MLAALFWDAEFFQLGGDVGAGFRGVDFFVDRQNFSIFANVERPTLGEAAFTADERRRQRPFRGSDWRGIA